MLSQKYFYKKYILVIFLLCICVNSYSENLATTFVVKPQPPLNPSSSQDCQNYNKQSHQYLNSLRRQSSCRIQTHTILANEGSAAMMAYLNSFVPVGSCCTQNGLGDCKLPPSCAPAKERYYCEKINVKEKLQECYSKVGTNKTDVNSKILTTGVKLLNKARSNTNAGNLSKKLTSRAISELEVRHNDAKNSLNNVLSQANGNKVNKAQNLFRIQNNINNIESKKNELLKQERAKERRKRELIQAKRKSSNNNNIRRKNNYADNWQKCFSGITNGYGVADYCMQSTNYYGSNKNRDRTKYVRCGRETKSRIISSCGDSPWGNEVIGGDF